MTFRSFAIFLALVFISATSVSSSAQETGAVPAVADPQAVTVASLEEQIKRVDAATDLDEETKKKTADLLRQAVDQAKRSEAYRAQLANLEAAARTINDRAEALKQRAKEFKEAQPPTVDSTRTLPELEQQLTQTEQLAKDLREKVAKADADIAARAAKLKTIRERIVEAKRQLEELSTQGATVAGDVEVLDAAKKADVNTQRQLLVAEIPALEAELALLDAENVADLPRLLRDDAVLELAATEKTLQLVQTAVRSGRMAEADKQIQTTQSKARNETDPLLRALSPTQCRACAAIPVTQ